MSFKNAFKIFVSRFSLVWVLALYLLIFGSLILLLALPFVSIIYKTVIGAGFADKLSAIFQSLIGGAPLSEVVSSGQEFISELTSLFRTDKTLSVTSTLLVIVVLIFAFRFLSGLYVLPLVKVLENYMSSNAKSSFTGGFIASLKKSSRYSLVNIIYTIAADTLIILILNALFTLLRISPLTVLAPIIISATLIVLLSLKYAFVCMWAPSVIIGGNSVFKGFAVSFKQSLKNFKSVFGSFVISWIFIIALNLFIGIFTLGAGLIATIPISMLFLSVLNVTLYYNKNSMRYYIDESVFTPPNA